MTDSTSLLQAGISTTMHIKSRGIVLTTIKYNDEGSIVHVLTKADGCKAFFVRNTKSKRSGVKPRLLQPLSLIDVEWDQRSATQDLLRMKSVTAKSWTTIPFDPVKSSISLFLSEFLFNALRSEPENPLLFDYIEQSLEWFDTCEDRHKLANFHLVFLLRLGQFLGFSPNLEEYREGTYFDMQTSTFQAMRPQHDNFLQPDEAALLPTMMRMQYATMHLFQFNGRQRSRLLEFACDYYRLHVAGFNKLKSLDVLKEVFAT